MFEQVPITCHDGQPMYSGFTPHWRDAQPIRDDGNPGTPYRTCSYCGSIHPADLVKAIEAGATMHGADWKYGWPHKFYMEKVPNPAVGHPVCYMSGSSYPSKEEAEQEGGKYLRAGREVRVTEFAPGRWEFKLFEPANAFTHAKWYNVHLKDLIGEEFALVADLLKKHTDIEWVMDEKGLKFSAPHGGYQK